MTRDGDPVVRLSKRLSFVLRHHPESIGIELDAEGWAEVEALLAALRRSGRGVTRDELERCVAENDKQRFVIRDGRIRANQGHSVAIELALDPIMPPDVLYHGTAVRNRTSIEAQGLLRRGRRHVHLSLDVATARTVCGRHGTPLVFRVAAGEMVAAGHAFFRSENRVWLTEHVPARFLEAMDT